MKRGWPAVAALAAAVATAWWALGPTADPPTATGPAASATAAAVPDADRASLPAKPAPEAAAQAPFTAAAEQARQAQRTAWLQRLERAQDVLQAYRESTRYPASSQPLALHSDQSHPNASIDEEHPLRGPGGTTVEGAKLHTSQERVYVQGSETVRFTVALRDGAGAVLPLHVTRASAREIPPPNSASLYPVVPLNFNDDGKDGDAVAGDGTFSVQLAPQVQGFNGLLGAIRVEAVLHGQDQEGPIHFDIVYTPQAPATWQGGIRETVEDGSLSFDFKVNVQIAGRYVATARVDDANGVPFALLRFNGEVPEGMQELRMTLFGKLVRDARPAFPLTLRDVDAFLLRADAFPDRLLMPRLPGKVHTSQTYGLTRFADAEWAGEERSRYLDEMGRDVAEAQAQLRKLGGP